MNKQDILNQLSWREKEIREVVVTPPSLKVIKRELAKRRAVRPIYQKDPYTHVIVEVGLSNSGYGKNCVLIEHGFSKCWPQDTFDGKRGVDVAVGHAIADLARKVQRDPELLKILKANVERDIDLEEE